MFGGIRIFVKNVLFECYNISVIDRSIEGMQCLLLVHKISNFSVIIFNCYLASVTLPHGKNETSYIPTLLEFRCRYGLLLW